MVLIYNALYVRFQISTINSAYLESTVWYSGGWRRLYSKPPIPDEAIWEVLARFKVHGIGTKPILALWGAKI